MEVHRRLRVADLSASSPRLRRGRVRLAIAALAAIMAAAAAYAAPISPADVDVKVPVYRIREPADRLNERWTYGFSWSGFPVGDATITVAERREAGPARLSVALRGRTNAMVAWLWSYRMDARGEIRLDPFAPSRFVSQEAERGTTKATRIEFDEQGQVQSYRRKGDREKRHSFAAPNTYDMISTGVLALNLDYTAGEVFRFDTLTGTARYLVQVRVVDRVKVGAARRVHDAWRLEILTRQLTDPGEVRKHEATELWVSAERPRRLLKARSKTFVGAITVDLLAIEPAVERLPERRLSDATPQASWYVDLRHWIP